MQTSMYRQTTDILHLFKGFQCVWVNFCDVVGFSASIEVFTNRIDIHKAVVSDFNALEVCEEST